MRTFARPFSVALVLAGVFVAIYPFVSVARVGGEAIDLLPVVAEGTTADDQHRLALFDSEFAVATRTYEATSLEAVRATFVQNESFQSYGRHEFSTECCGDYDGVWVTLAEGTDGTVTATLVPTDSDIQSTWPMLSILGSLIAGLGFALRRSSTNGPTTADESEVDDLGVVLVR